MSFSAAKSQLRDDLNPENTVSINQVSNISPSALCVLNTYFFSLDYFWCPSGRPQPCWRTCSSLGNLTVVQPRCHPASPELPRLSFILSSPTLDEVILAIFTHIPPFPICSALVKDVPKPWETRRAQREAQQGPRGLELL